MATTFISNATEGRRKNRRKHKYLCPKTVVPHVCMYDTHYCVNLFSYDVVVVWCFLRQSTSNPSEPKSNFVTNNAVASVRILFVSEASFPKTAQSGRREIIWCRIPGHTYMREDPSAASSPVGVSFPTATVVDILSNQGRRKKERANRSNSRLLYACN